MLPKNNTGVRLGVAKRYLHENIKIFSNGIWCLQRNNLGFTRIAFGQSGDKRVAKI